MVMLVMSSGRVVVMMMVIVMASNLLAGEGHGFGGGGGAGVHDEGAFDLSVHLGRRGGQHAHSIRHSFRWKMGRFLPKE